MQRVRPFVIDERTVICGWAVPIGKDKRSIVTRRSNPFVPSTRALELPLVRASAEAVLAVGRGHEGGEAFVQPEMSPLGARDHVAPPLMGELVGGESGTARVVQH